jgi:hypothetical protein
MVLCHLARRTALGPRRPGAFWPPH